MVNGGIGDVEYRLYRFLLFLFNCVILCNWRLIGLESGMFVRNVFCRRFFFFLVSVLIGRFICLFCL